MAIVYRIPSNVSLDQVTQEYFVEHEKFIGEKILPFTPSFAQRVQWDERDNERGMTGAHQLGTEPRIVGRRGSKLREYDPIYFKETDVIREDELLRARQLGTLGGVVDLSELMGRTIRVREDKNFIRAEFLRWQALRGEIHVHENGVNVDETFPIQIYNVTTGWDDRANAKPLRDMNAVKLLFRGTGASAKGAIAYCNQFTLNLLLENANQNDIQGFRSQNFLSTAFSIDELNRIQSARGLPTFEAYDEGYIDDDDEFQTFLEDGEVIVIGKRPAGQVVGDLVMTASLHREERGMPAPGMFTIVEVNGQPNRSAVEVSTSDLGAGKNPRIEVTGGFYGGPRLLYPRSVVKMNVLD
jgi:hypothetical protein